ncbi:MAG: glycosyltransferase family 2 protein [Gammaproteobacteria bacterium]
MRLWVCIPVHNRLSFTDRCLAALRNQNYPHHHVVLCDDGSSDGTGDFVRTKYPEVALLAGDGKLWWTGATNACIDHALAHGDENDAVVTLNNDLEVEPDYLSRLAQVASRYPDAIVTSASHDIKTRELRDPGYRHSWLTAGFRAIEPLMDHLPGDTEVAEVTHAAGRGTLIPFRVLRRVGLFDFRRLPHYGADYDFSFRARRAGFRIVVAFGAKVFSHVDETGLTRARQKFSLGSFYRYLTDRKTPTNLRSRFWVAAKNCPGFLLPSYLVIDIARVVGGYFKFHLRRALPAN